MGYVNPAPITALYNNTTPGVAADPQAMDNAVGAIVDAVNANYDTAQTTNADFSGHKHSETLDHPDGSITTPKIRDASVTTPKIPDGAITAPKIAIRGVTKDRIAIGAVGYQEIDPSLATLIPNVAIQAKFQDLDAQMADKATLTAVEVVGDPKIVGHRGLSGVAPENSIPSYVIAGKAGLWGAETDIQRTSDGVWVLMHDMDVDRMTNGTGFVKDLTIDYIRSLKIDSGVNIGLYPNLKVPTLEEYLMVCKQYKMVPVIEVKSLFVAADCVDLVNVLKKYNFEENCIVLTADLLILWEIRKYSKRIHCQYLATISSTSLMHVINMGNASINEYYETLTKAKIEQAHAASVSVNTWTVNSYEKARELISFGVDMLSTDVIADIKF